MALMCQAVQPDIAEGQFTAGVLYLPPPVKALNSSA